MGKTESRIPRLNSVFFRRVMILSNILLVWFVFTNFTSGASVSDVEVIAADGDSGQPIGGSDRRRRRERAEARRRAEAEREAGESEEARDGESSSAPPDWTIVLAVFRGERQVEAANVMLSRTRTEGGLPQAYMEKRGPATIVGVGRFSDPTSKRAQEELKRIKTMVISGLQPYSFCYLGPPWTGSLSRITPEYDLRKAKTIYGPRATVTVQVGFYGREDLKNPTQKQLTEMRRIAEQAVLQLRREGELAFYYHSRFRSTVTIGIFDQEDLNDRTGYNKFGPRIEQVRERHQYNLYNGKAYKARNRSTGKMVLVESHPVAIPDA